MLVLSRKKDETIVINKNIEVTIVDIRGDKIRVGIKAPPEITIHREELLKTIPANQKLPETPVDQ